jgi:hypothetical protein
VPSSLPLDCTENFNTLVTDHTNGIGLSRGQFKITESALKKGNWFDQI